jgi:hypothetical protein
MTRIDGLAGKRVLITGACTRNVLHVNGGMYMP